MEGKRRFLASLGMTCNPSGIVGKNMDAARAQASSLQLGDGSLSESLLESPDGASEDSSGSELLWVRAC